MKIIEFFSLSWCDFHAPTWHFCTFDHLSERPVALLRKTACASLETESFDNAPAKGLQAISLLFPLRFYVHPRIFEKFQTYQNSMVAMITNCTGCLQANFYARDAFIVSVDSPYNQMLVLPNLMRKPLKPAFP